MPGAPNVVPWFPSPSSAIERHRANDAANASVLVVTDGDSENGSPGNARQRSGSGARRIEQQVAVAANPLALPSGMAREHGCVENLLDQLSTRSV